MFEQVVDIEPAAPGPKELAYDTQWLAILRETHDLLTPGTFSRLPASWTGAALPCLGNGTMMAVLGTCPGQQIPHMRLRLIQGPMLAQEAVVCDPQAAAHVRLMQLLLFAHIAKFAGTAAPQPPPAEEHMAWVEAALDQHGRTMPANFCQTVPVHSLQVRAVPLHASTAAVPCCYARHL